MRRVLLAGVVVAGLVALGCGSADTSGLTFSRPPDGGLPNGGGGSTSGGGASGTGGANGSSGASNGGGGLNGGGASNGGAAGANSAGGSGAANTGGATNGAGGDTGADGGIGSGADAGVGADASAGGTGSGTGGSVGAGGNTSTGGAVGAGGAVGSGGAIGSGGAVGSGGAIGSGGAVGSGGAIGSGGAVGSGGTIGAGGAVGSGGAIGAGGAVGSGGAIGSGGAVGAGGSASCVPTGPERCDGVDNDCNGAIDDGNPGGGVSCGPTLGGCVAVRECQNGSLVCLGTFVGPAPTGSDTNPGTEALPLATIGQAILNATIIGNGADVCVCDAPAAGASTFTEDITMVEGTSVLGGYACTSWARAIGTNVTRIADTTASGIKFPAGITPGTSLDGFTVVGAAQNSGTSSALTVTGSSPILQDLTVQGGAAPVSVGLAVGSGGGKASPAVVNGTYTASATAGGTQVAIGIDTASPSFANVAIGGLAIGGAPTAATAFGVACSNCAGTTFSGGSITGGQATTTVAGFSGSGDLSSLQFKTGNILGGNVTSAAGEASGVLLSSCTGAPAMSGVTITGGFGQAGARVGVDVSGGSCAATITGGGVRGCETGSACTGILATGAPIQVTSVPTLTGAAGGALQTYGIRCLAGGCESVTRSTITAGVVTGSASVAVIAMGVDIEGSDPTFDSDNVRGASCPNPTAGGAYHTVYIEGASPRIENSVLRDGTCTDMQDVVRYQKAASAGSAVANPIVVNDTIEYTSCPTCPPRYGITILSPGGSVGPSGSFNNDIVHDTVTNGKSIPVYETDTDSDPLSFMNNDVYSTVGALYVFHGVTSILKAGAVDTIVNGASGTIAADPLLDATWHIPSNSPCRDAGTAKLAPDHDFDNPPDARPQQSTFDIGADEFAP